MEILQWEEVGDVSRPFIKAEIINININFEHLCGGRFWGSTNFSLNLTFSIHERMDVGSNGWQYQLLAPNGIHVYCKDIEEAKEVAEIMCRRIFEAFSLQMNRKPKKLPEGEVAKKLNVALESMMKTREGLNLVLYNRFCKRIKKKKDKLNSLLNNYKVDGRIFYSRIPKSIGWMFCVNGQEPVLIGSNYQQALEYFRVNFSNNLQIPVS